jgi:hypothetical protein
MIERNAEWAAVMRAELKDIWDGYSPNSALVTPNDTEGDEPLYNASSLDDLEERRAARRAEMAMAERPKIAPLAPEGTSVPETG